MSIADGKLDDGVLYDGHDISHSLFSKEVKADDDPVGVFVYWCGNYINAIRINEHKVIYRTQNFVGATPIGK